jgi:hypothetical protein
MPNIEHWCPECGAYLYPSGDGRFAHHRNDANYCHLGRDWLSLKDMDDYFNGGGDDDDPYYGHDRNYYAMDLDVDSDDLPF